MGNTCSCDTDESTFNAGIVSCTVKHMGCFGKKDMPTMTEEQRDEMMNDIANRVAQMVMKKEANAASSA